MKIYPKVFKLFTFYQKKDTMIKTMYDKIIWRKTKGGYYGKIGFKTGNDL